MLPRFFADAALTIGDAFRLPDDAAHHALHVLRLRSGAPIVLFNGRGGEYRARLATVAGEVVADIDTYDPVERESPLKLTLLQALVAAEKLDWIVEKAVELGVDAIAVAPARRSVVRLDADHPSFEALLSAATIDSCRLMLLPEAPGPLPPVAPDRSAALLVGPEGGLADDEQALAVRAGFIPTRLGPRVLRTETAGVAALAALQALGGDLAAYPG